MRHPRMLCLLLITLALAGPMTGAAGGRTAFISSCDNDPCGHLPYSFAVSVNGELVPHMDTNLFSGHPLPAGAPVLEVTREGYGANADGTVTGTVTSDLHLRIEVSEPLGNDVTAYFEGGIMQDGHGCPPGPCSIPSYPCTLTAGLTSTDCSIGYWWQSYWSGAPDVGGGTYNVIYTDPGQPNVVILNGHPNSYGYGFTIIPSFVPLRPGRLASLARGTAAHSFKIHYHSLFGGNFRLLGIRRGRVVYSRFLGWKTPAHREAWFDCRSFHVKIGLVVVGARDGRIQTSQTKRVEC